MSVQFIEETPGQKLMLHCYSQNKAHQGICVYYNTYDYALHNLV
jgi:hypothetical protein